jgi:hypothetical protein
MSSQGTGGGVKVVIIPVPLKFIPSLAVQIPNGSPRLINGYMRVRIGAGV